MSGLNGGLQLFSFLQILRKRPAQHPWKGVHCRGCLSQVCPDRWVSCSQSCPNNVHPGADPSPCRWTGPSPPHPGPPPEGECEEGTDAIRLYKALQITNNLAVCYFMLCYVMLCYVMSCHVMLCYLMLCQVLLHYVSKDLMINLDTVLVLFSLVYHTAQMVWRSVHNYSVSYRLWGKEQTDL